jgi:WhiB family transcriptional regulator, redox-sensing transcriptional regulator
MTVLGVVVPFFARTPERLPCTTVDPDVFWPVATGGGADATAELKAKTAEAVRICRRCPARAECLAWAVKHERDGIWGGTTEGERAAMRRRRTA